MVARKDSTLNTNLELDGLRREKTTSGSAPVCQELYQRLQRAQAHPNNPGRLNIGKTSPAQSFPVFNWPVKVKHTEITVSRPFWCLTWILTDTLNQYLRIFFAFHCCNMIGWLDNRMNVRVFLLKWIECFWSPDTIIMFLLYILVIKKKDPTPCIFK